MKDKEMLYIKQNGDCYIDKDCKWENMNKEDKIKELTKDMGVGFQLSRTTRFGPVAAELVEIGYPRIKKDYIVISKEEYDKYQNLKRDVEHSFEYNQGYTDGQIKGNKETAEKFVNLDKSDILVVDTQEYGEIEVVSVERLQELAKQFNVEIKE